MKKLIFLLVSLILISSPIHAAIFTSVKSGNWSSGDTWNQSGAIPGPSDNVVIGELHIINIDANAFCYDLTIDQGGTLELTVSETISVFHNTLIQGTFTISDGVVNSGDAKSHTFHIYGGVLNFSGGIINIAGRFKQSLSISQCNITGNGNLNISTSGEQATSTYNNLSVSNGMFSISSSSSAQIILKNGNSTSKEEIYFSPQTSNFEGGSIVIENGSGLSDIYIDVDMPIFKIVSDVGTGNIFHFDANCEFTLDDLTVTSGSVQIDVGAELDITGDIITNNAFIVESNASGNASLIASGTMTGSTTVQRYIEAFLGDSDGWHEISSPVINMPIDGSTLDPGINDDLFAWDESSNIWLNHKIGVNNITSFLNGEGYLVAYESSQTHEFNGVLNNADVTFSNLSVGIGGGWHLLGNTFSSAIKWGTSAWELSNISGVAKVFNESTGNYEDLSGGDVIPATNGFFIQAVTSTNQIKIPASERVHSSDNNYKNSSNSQMETVVIEVFSNQNSYSDKTKVGFKYDATNGWDIMYDSRKLSGNIDAPQLTTLSDGEELSTNYLPYVIGSCSVSLNFYPGTTGSFTLVASNLSSFFQNSVIILEDRKTGVLIDLFNNPTYTFTANISDANNRFLIYFHGVTYIGEVNEDPVNIFTYERNIVIECVDDEQVSGSLSIVNLLGQILIDKDINLEKNGHAVISLTPGCYLVSLSTSKGNISEKIIIKQ